MKTSFLRDLSPSSIQTPEDISHTSDPSTDPYTADLQSSSPRDSKNSIYDNRKVLSTFLVVSLCFFNVSGGPVGSESIIAAGGPLVGILSVLIFPFVWAIPISLVTAELSTAYPADGGYTVWVYHAFGPFWAFLEGYLSWMSGVLDNSMYPALAMSAFSKGLLGTSSMTTYLIKASIAIVLTIPGIFGVKIVGKGMAVMTFFVVIPFLVLSVWGLVKSGSDWSVLEEVRRDANGNTHVEWSRLINIVFWNFNGFDGMSVFAEEVSNPSRTYPRALFISVLFITFSYLFPLISATLVNDPKWSTWEEGSFTEIARSLGGTWLTISVLISCLLSNCSMFMTELFIDSFQLYGMAKKGLAPKFFSKRHPKYDTPINSIIASLIIILGVVSFDFQAILDMNNALNCLSLLPVIWGAVRLRYSASDVPRPYKVPGGNIVLLLLVIMMSILVAYVICTAFTSMISLYISLGTLAVGILYGLHIDRGGYLDGKFRSEKQLPEDSPMPC